MSEALSPAQLTAYLARLGLSGPHEPTLATLTALHVAHQRTIPFENLDIHLGVPIRLGLAHVFEKVVARRRGGYCYELNGLFAALLAGLGFEVRLLSCRVAEAPGAYAPEFDHLALRVTCPGAAGAYLADVGFGDGPLAPLPLAPGLVRDEGQRRLALHLDGEDWTYAEDGGDGWRPRYTFRLTPHALAEFEPRNRYHQTSPESHFTHGPVCSLVTADGRITLAHDRLIVTSGGRRTEERVDEARLPEVLWTRFGVRLERP